MVGEDTGKDQRVDQDIAHEGPVGDEREIVPQHGARARGIQVQVDIAFPQEHQNHSNTAHRKPGGDPLESFKLPFKTLNPQKLARSERKSREKGPQEMSSNGRNRAAVMVVRSTVIYTESRY